MMLDERIKIEFRFHVFFLYIFGTLFPCVRKNVSRNTSISNGNRTEWSTIQGVIGRVISNRPSA